MREHRDELRTIGEQAKAPSFNDILADFGRSGVRIPRTEGCLLAAATSSA